MRTLTIFAVLFALAPLAGADQCEWTTSEPEVDTNPLGVEGVPRYYVDGGPCPSDMCFYSLWIYEESNGIDGLQRADEAVDDTCEGQIAGDTILF